MSEMLQAKTKPNAKRSLQRKRAQRKEDEIKPKRKAMRSAYLQKKMDVSTPGDPQEQEADRVADEVSRMPRSAARKQQAQRTALAPEDNAEQPQSLQTKIQRQQDEAVQTKLMRAEDELQTKLQREADEEGGALQPTLNRQLDGEEATAGAKLFRQNGEEAETVQPKLQRETDEASLQAKGAPELSDEAERKIEALRGQGMPLPEEVRQEMEEKMSANFSSVSIHTGGDAAELCKQINARAFTVGSDIFFAAGEYAPENEAGRKLLAHELTHVVQQSRGASRKAYRAENDESRNQDSGTISGGTITFRNIKVPTYFLDKYSSEKPLYRNKNYIGSRPTGNQNQRVKWRQEVLAQGGGLRNNVDILTSKLEAARQPIESGRTYVFKAPSRNQRATGRNPRLLIGSLENIASAATLPTWDKDDNPQAETYDVDHVVELVVSNWPARPRANALSNYQLLVHSQNESKKQIVTSDLNSKIRSFKSAYSEYSDRNVNDIKRGFTMKFEEPVAGSGRAPSSNDYWQRDEIQRGDHLSALQPGGMDDLGREGQVWIFPEEGGGVKTTFSTDGRLSSYARNQWLKPFIIKSSSFDTQTDSSETPLGSITLNVKDNDGEWGFPSDESETVHRYPGSRYAGYLNKNSMRSKLYRLSKTHLSPIEISSFGVSDSGGIELQGQINPTLPIIQDSSIQFELSEGELIFSKGFNSGEISAPPPFNVSDCNLIISSSTRGLGVEGGVDFGINNVGEGNITAEFSSNSGLSFNGEFNFDKRIFGEGTNAQVTVGYQNDEWSMGGSITIPEGKVPGIKTATITVDYSEGDGFSAQGDAELDVPGVESGTLSITSSEEEGFSIGGSFNLSADTPGIRGGTISAEVRERPDGTGFALSASGEAQPDIPGINANLLVSYNDGAFTAEVTAQYARGMLSGEILAGVTNRSVGEDGQLSETAEAGNPLIVYGGGSLTLQIAPWLQGTAGVQFAPDGEITVSGEIGLPDQLEIFSRSEINKSIFNIAVQAPIVPGIVAEIGGGLSAQAGIGPGVIDELRLGITYNPAREEETRITGNAHLTIPADAGLRLAVRAGIGLGITGASVTGGLEIGGTLGITGAAEAGVQVEWSPASGLAIDADVSVSAQPSFIFDISGYVSVRALGFSVYDETYRFASFEFGSDYRFGISLPIRYREGEPFDISLDDVEFEVPNIDTNQLMRSLISRVT